ncbi:hypothetical protein GCM10011571_26290 [Marinithermofilum abyssi]|uniref:Uncharacterized protein n=1 Tax=Marinithermofilum abyssi TaxID=1571185 RepID=A0A8J2VIK5_9BACL|nr:hypothetical protein [Marinithermofilum abyssi]GGE22963.1 hypothetical protein GCM10011571_26290 [Marinithermofilum abyssi]
MKLKIKSINGLTRPREQVDHFLKSQGFVCRPSHHPVYDIRIEDAASGQVYRLRIPTHHHLSLNQSAYLRLGEPTLSQNSKFQKNQFQGDIPDSVMQAANDKIAEIVSYLQSSPE